MMNQSFSSPELLKQREKLQKRLAGIRNEMEFVEILAQFWPLPNMALKVERLQAEIARLDQLTRRMAYSKAG